MASTINPPTGAARQAEVREALARYPYLDDAELSDLLHWFRKEASAFEAAKMASEPALARPYQRLKAEHLDRISGAEMFWGITIATLTIGALGAIVWTAL